MILRCHLNLATASLVTDLNWLSTVKEIKDELLANGHTVKIPNELWTLIAPQLTTSNSTTKLIHLLFGRNRTDDTLVSLNNNLASPSASNSAAHIGELHNAHKEQFVASKEDIYKVQIFYLGFICSVADLYANSKKVFNNIVFLDFHDFSKYVNSDCTEVLTAFRVLNDDAMRILRIECNSDAGKAEKKLTAMGIECTGLSRRERPDDFKKSITIDNVTRNVSFAPHIKIDNKKGSDKRIYFAWGIDGFAGSRIIIYSIGRHFPK